MLRGPRCGPQRHYCLQQEHVSVSKAPEDECEVVCQAERREGSLWVGVLEMPEEEPPEHGLGVDFGELLGLRRLHVWRGGWQWLIQGNGDAMRQDTDAINARGMFWTQ